MGETLTDTERVALQYAAPGRWVVLDDGRTARGKAQRALLSRGLLERNPPRTSVRITAAGRAALAGRSTQEGDTTTTNGETSDG